MTAVRSTSFEGDEERSGSRTSDRFPASVDTALRAAGWQPSRWDIKQAETWADELRAYVSPGGHQHSVFPAAVEAWAEFGALTVPPQKGKGQQIAPTGLVVDPIHGLHLARTFADLGRALDTEVCPLGAEADGQAHLAIDAHGRVYAIDHTGDWYLGETFDQALVTLVTGVQPMRLAVGG